MQRRHITAMDVDRFTNGHCHQLATSIVSAMGKGWHVCSFATDDDPIPDVHAFAETPSGMYLDIRGLHTAKEIISQWQAKYTGELIIIRVPDNHDWERDGWDNLDFGFADSCLRARQLVPELIHRYQRKD